MAQRGLKGSQLKQVSSPKLVWDLVQKAEELSGSVATDWDTTTPRTVEDAVNRLAAAFTALLQKLDLDTGVTDTDYESTIQP